MYMCEERGKPNHHTHHPKRHERAPDDRHEVVRMRLCTPSIPEQPDRAEQAAEDHEGESVLWLPFSPVLRHVMRVYLVTQSADDDHAGDGSGSQSRKVSPAAPVEKP